MANINDILYGNGNRDMFVGDNWLPSTTNYPSNPREGQVFIAEDAGTVNGEDYEIGDSIIYRNATDGWERLGSSGGSTDILDWTPTESVNLAYDYELVLDDPNNVIQNNTRISDTRIRFQQGSNSSQTISIFDKKDIYNADSTMKGVFFTIDFNGNNSAETFFASYVNEGYELGSIPTFVKYVRIQSNATFGTASLNIEDPNNTGDVHPDSAGSLSIADELNGTNVFFFGMNDTGDFVFYSEFQNTTTPVAVHRFTSAPPSASDNQMFGLLSEQLSTFQTYEYAIDQDNIPTTPWTYNGNPLISHYQESNLSEGEVDKSSYPTGREGLSYRVSGVASPLKDDLGSLYNGLVVSFDHNGNMIDGGPESVFHDVTDSYNITEGTAASIKMDNQAYMDAWFNSAHNTADLYQFQAGNDSTDPSSSLSLVGGDLVYNNLVIPNTQSGGIIVLGLNGSFRNEMYATFDLTQLSSYLDALAEGETFSLIFRLLENYDLGPPAPEDNMDNVLFYATIGRSTGVQGSGPDINLAPQGRLSMLLYIPNYTDTAIIGTDTNAGFLRFGSDNTTASFLSVVNKITAAANSTTGTLELYINGLREDLYKTVDLTTYTGPFTELTGRRITSSDKSLRLDARLTVDNNMATSTQSFPTQVSFFTEDTAVAANGYNRPPLPMVYDDTTLTPGFSERVIGDLKYGYFNKLPVEMDILGETFPAGSIVGLTTDGKEIVSLGESVSAEYVTLEVPSSGSDTVNCEIGKNYMTYGYGTGNMTINLPAFNDAELGTSFKIRHYGSTLLTISSDENMEGFGPDDLLTWLGPYYAHTAKENMEYTFIRYNNYWQGYATSIEATKLDYIELTSPSTVLEHGNRYMLSTSSTLSTWNVPSTITTGDMFEVMFEGTADSCRLRSPSKDFHDTRTGEVYGEYYDIQKGEKCYIVGDNATQTYLVYTNLAMPSSVSNLTVSNLTVDTAGNGAFDIINSDDANATLVFQSGGDMELASGANGSLWLQGLKMPNADGTSTQVLKTDGNGGLYFADDASFDPTADSTVTGEWNFFTEDGSTFKDFYVSDVALTDTDYNAFGVLYRNSDFATANSINSSANVAFLGSSYSSANSKLNLVSYFSETEATLETSYGSEVSTLSASYQNGAVISYNNSGSVVSSVTAYDNIVTLAADEIRVTGGTVKNSTSVATMDDVRPEHTVITGATYSLTDADHGKTLYFTSASTVILTIDKWSIQDGDANDIENFECNIIQGGDGSVVFTPNNDEVIRNVDGHTRSRGKYAIVTLLRGRDAAGVFDRTEFIIAGSTV